MTTRSQEPPSKSRAYEQGQRLYCQNCGLEVEIINPGTRTLTALVVQCCGRDITPEPGVSVHLDD